MFTAIAIMLLGILLGRLLRGQRWLPFLVQGISPVIMLMLFCLGIAVGGNAELMEDLPQLGGKAALLTLGGIGGSLLGVAAIRRFFELPRSPLSNTVKEQKKGH